MRKTIIAIAAALALIGASTGITLAATSSSPSFILACYSNKTHVMYHRTGPKCPRGYTSLIWNVQGPRGLRGSQGPAGPSTAGLAGLDVTTAMATNANGGNAAVAVCPASQPYVIGGGYSLTTTSPALINMPTTSSGFGAWEAQLEGSSYQAGSVWAYALCAK